MLKGSLLSRVVIFSLLAITLAISGSDVDGQTPTWEAFELADLVSQRADADVAFLEFLDRDSMSAGLLELAPGDVDEREATNLDTVFYIFEGSGVLAVGEENVNVEPGMVIYTQASEDARFSEVTESLQVIVTTIKSQPSTLAPKFLSFSQDTIESRRNPVSNVWNPFLRRPNVVMGIYMLPGVIGGDGSLTHPFDELNIVTSGASRFRMDDDDIALQEASIVFIQAGVGHFFHDLTENTDILILWEQP